MKEKGSNPLDRWLAWLGMHNRLIMNLLRWFTRSQRKNKHWRQNRYWTFFSHRNLLNLIKGKLVFGSIVELRRASGFVSGNLLGRLKRSVAFKIDRNSSGPEWHQSLCAESSGKPQTAT